MKSKSLNIDRDIRKDRESTVSLAFTHITDPSQLQFQNQDNFYVYKPAKKDANIFHKILAPISLCYYKYLLHTGVYVMSKNERRIFNGVVVLSVFLSSYQLYLMISNS